MSILECKVFNAISPLCTANSISVFIVTILKIFNESIIVRFDILIVKYAKGNRKKDFF